MTWIGALQDLGHSVIDLAKAEVDVGLARLKRSVFELLKVVIFAVLALIIFFYLPFLVLLTGIDALRALAGWPLWAAALTLLGIFVLAIALLGALAAFKIKRKIESPVATVTRRLDDHSAWWHERVAYDTRRIEPSRKELQ